MSLRLPPDKTDSSEVQTAGGLSDWSSLLRTCAGTVSGEPLSDTVPDLSSLLAAAYPPHPVPTDVTSLGASPGRSVPTTIGRYELRELLDAGGQATIHRAWDPLLQREVAIKLAHLDHENLLLDGSHLCEEGALLAQVRHPGLAEVFDCGTVAGHFYLVMELVSGCTLRQYIGSYEMSPQEICRVVTELADALGTAHRQGVLHLDIKPDNVMVMQDGHCKLIDFGMGALLSTLASFPLPLQAGTPEFMSPEQHRGDVRDWSAATDVFGLGGLLAFLLKSRAPFPDPESSEASRWQQLEDLKITLRDGPHRALAAIACRALNFEPGDRYANADEMAGALRATIRSRHTGALCLTAGILSLCAGLATLWPNFPGAISVSANIAAVSAIACLELQIITPTEEPPVVVIWSPTLGVLTVSGLERLNDTGEFRWISHQNGGPVAVYCPDAACVAVCSNQSIDTSSLSAIFSRFVSDNRRWPTVRENTVSPLLQNGQSDIFLVSQISEQGDLHWLSESLRNVPGISSASLVQFANRAEPVQATLGIMADAIPEESVPENSCPSCP